MANPNKTNPTWDGVWIESIELAPQSTDSKLNQIPAVCQSVALLANANGVNDYFLLPAASEVPNGHRIMILAGAAACEMRTPQATTDKINNVDCSDNATEYLVGALDIIQVTKINNTVGWEAHSVTELGADLTAVIPD